MSFPPAEVTDLVGKISKILNARNETISVSESVSWLNMDGTRYFCYDYCYLIHIEFQLLIFIFIFCYLTIRHVEVLYHHIWYQFQAHHHITMEELLHMLLNRDWNWVDGRRVISKVIRKYFYIRSTAFSRDLYSRYQSFECSLLKLTTVK